MTNSEDITTRHVKQFYPSAQSRDRILLIGPVLPYRGGIAQHTTMLHRALTEQATCLTLSFSRQYPRWLFPGKSDRDENMAGHLEEGVEYIIDSVNPLSWYRALKRAKTFAPRLVVFPWWHVYWAPCFIWFCRQFKKNRVEIVFLCHNAVEHESARWKGLISDLALSYADRFVVHTSVDKKNLLARFPQTPVEVHPLPVFDHFPAATEKLPRRAKLELLFFGFVRPYKGLDVLLEAMTFLKNEDVFLSIVGEFWNGENETLKYIADHNLTEKIEVVPHYVPDKIAAAYFTRSDVVVLPYHSATGSAVIPLAYHYGKPVIATRVGGLPDVVEDGVTGKLIDAGSTEQLIDAVKKIESGAIFFNSNAIVNFKKSLTWNGLANSVVTSLKQAQNLHNFCNASPARTHAILDSSSREAKAKKIVALVEQNGISVFRRILEVGTGSGFIASYLAKSKCSDVYAVDIADERQTTEGFKFQQVQGTTLPFPDGHFDFMISNHVIEHVGGLTDQKHHLHEAFRCLEPGGTLYFAVPNRWRLIEPHYKLPLLSWLPEKLASAYVRLFKLGTRYDCKPLSRKEATNLLRQSGFECVDATVDAISLLGKLEGGWLVQRVAALPKSFWKFFFVIMPTLIFVCRKPLV